MGERVRNVPIGAHFILKRTGDKYELLGHKRDTPGGTQYVVRRVEDRTGRWIEFDDAHELFDPVAVDAARPQAKQGGV